MLKIRCFAPKDYFGANTYLVSSGGEFAVIDPSVSYDEIASQIPELGRVKYVLLTHGHFDHIIKLDEWAEHADEIIVGVGDGPMLSDEYLNCYLGFLGVKDGYYGRYSVGVEGDTLPLGGDIIEIREYPGHTPGGLGFRVRENLFVGDTVFADGGYGRCDLPGGDEDLLEKSLIKLFTHEADCILYPGHGKSQWLHDAIKYFM